MSKFCRLWAERRGATAIEYALIATLIAVIIVGALTLVGSEVGNNFNEVANNV